MEHLAICVLTRGRADRQITLENLHPHLLRHTYLVVDDDEHSIYYNWWKSYIKKLVYMPRKHTEHNFKGNFSDKKDWIARRVKERYIIFVDDDLKFDARVDDKLIKASKIQNWKAFNLLYRYMRHDGFAHVALSPREGNNRVEEDYRDSTRAMRVCGFDLKKVFFDSGLSFNRLPLMADFDITLSLLELGYPNRVLYKYANGQRKSNDDGGCSLYRTPKLMTEAAQGLYSLHPQFVKVQQKKTSKPWAGFDTNVRTDVTVAWRKAYDYGKNRSKKGISDLL